MIKKIDRKKLKENRKLLDAEAASRKKRIKIRREQRLKIEAARRIKSRKRMFKLTVIWIGLIILALYISTWFSADLVNWLHQFSR